MSDTDNPTDEQAPEGEQTGTDAADLKARLGLRTRKRRVGRPTSASLGAGGDVAEARQRAEEASSEAGTPEEAFSAFESDKTPLPQVLPGSDTVGMVDDMPAGAGKIATKPLIVLLLVVAAVSMLLGQVLGGSLEQQGLWDTHASYTKDRLEAMNKAKTKSGAELIPTLVAYQDALKATSKELEAAKLLKVGSEEARSKVLKSFMETTKAFATDGAYFNPKALMDDILVLYKDDQLLASVSFATKTRHLHDLATSAVNEAKAYDRMAAGPFLAARVKSGGKGGASKGILIKQTEQEVPEIGKIPAAEGAWILDTGKPRKVKVVGKKRNTEPSERWEMMVVEVGQTAEQAVQVPTSAVMKLDMTPEYESHAQLLQQLKWDRLEVVVASLKAVSDTIRWSDLEKQLQEHAAEAQ